MVIFRSTEHIEAAPSTVFDVYADVANWPAWTASVSEVRRMDSGPLQIGSRAHVRQPRLPAGIWTVVDLAPGQSFSWERRGPGLLTTGRHIIEPDGSGCQVIAELEHTGALAKLVGRLTEDLTRHYLRVETTGLKTRCEQPPDEVPAR